MNWEIKLSQRNKITFKLSYPNSKETIFISGDLVDDGRTFVITADYDNEVGFPHLSKGGP